VEKDLEELSVLIKYLVHHNADHAGEITQFADRAATAGATSVQAELLQAAELLQTANEHLSSALAML